MGAAWSFIKVQYPGKPAWSTDESPDLTGKVFVVTGASAGIGKETAKVLLEKKAKVYFACRSKEKTAAVIKEFKELTGNEGLYLEVDLADLRSVKKAAEEFIGRETRLDVLINNAGVMSPKSEFTAQGFDMTFGTNFLGPAYFTHLLLPLLVSTSKTTGTPSRVVNLSSFIHHTTPGHTLDFNTFKSSPARDKMAPMARYAQSKFAIIMYSNQLAKRYDAKELFSVSLHPGVITSELMRDLPWFMYFSFSPMNRPPQLGALTSLRAAIDDRVLEWNGKFMQPWAKLGDPHPGTNNEKLADELWVYLEEQIKAFEDSVAAGEPFGDNAQTAGEVAQN